MEHVIWPFLQMRAGYREQQKTRSIPALGAHGGPAVRNPPANAGDVDSIPGSERSPGEGNSNPLQHSCLENSMDGGAWWATVHGLAKSWTQLSDFTFSSFIFLKIFIYWAVPGLSCHMKV